MFPGGHGTSCHGTWGLLVGEFNPALVPVCWAPSHEPCPLLGSCSEDWGQAWAD